MLRPSNSASLKCPNAGIVGDSYTKVTVFNDCFASPFTPDNHSIPSCIQPPVYQCHISLSKAFDSVGYS